MKYLFFILLFLNISLQKDVINITNDNGIKTEVAYSINCSEIRAQTYSCNQTQPITDNKVPVIIISGQSNAVGQFAGKNYGHLQIPLTYRNVVKDSIFIWYEGNYLTKDTNTGTFVNLNCNTNTFGKYTQTDPSDAGYDVGEMSLETPTANYLSEYYGGRKVYVIKSAKGSLNIPSWSLKSGAQWIELERYIRRATDTILARGEVPYFVSMGWLQGESDIIDGIAGLYLPRLRTFVANVRAINAYTANMQFVCCKLSLYGNTPIDSMALINNAFDSLHHDNPTLNKVIETAGSTYYNSLHYDVPALINMSQMWFEWCKIDMINKGIITYQNKIIR